MNFLLLNIKVDNAVKDGKVNGAAIAFNKLGELEILQLAKFHMVYLANLTKANLI